MIDSTGPAWDAIIGLSRFAALAAMAELGCAEHLAAGPMDVAELAKACDAHEPSLARLLRELEALGVVRAVAPGTYELTEEGQTLRDGVPGSMRSALRMAAETGYWYAMGNLAQTVKEGRSAFISRFGPLYGYFQEQPEAARLFNEYMAIRAAPLEAALATAYDFTGVKTFVDIAGGTGHLLAAVLDQHPGMRGVLFDIAHVVENARESLNARGLGDRCEFESGDFFEGVPEGGDLYLLASVIHNWSDEASLRILTNVRKAALPHGRLLLLEMVLPDDGTPHIGKDLDMRMLALTEGGMERTLGEHTRLLGEAGFTLSRVLPLPAGASLIEALPR
ncbi:methyltransferase [Microbispora bryophytorum]|uniref:Methyltransferase n=2 Tax=Microbispora bryophytorum TaxID=1460882 RepID=A0A8H9LKE5_9ACTN|nr:MULTISPECIES: methyltransferase [Microbispora]GGO32593.1 methyltransferase [Microbispora bryophytorum]